MLQDEYARAIIALHEEGKNDAEIASGIAQVLRARGHERLIPRIARSLQAYELRKSKKDARVLRVSKIEDTTIFAKEIADALSALKEDGRAYETVVDDRIVGGFVLASGTTMVDASYRTALVSLYRTITADR